MSCSRGRRGWVAGLTLSPGGPSGPALPWQWEEQRPVSPGERVQLSEGQRPGWGTHLVTSLSLLSRGTRLSRITLGGTRQNGGQLLGLIW